ncbi:MAG: hypothetical protein JSU95_11265 [Betaproteobacteria bacterium]|nr:MAG: hypothetical protein JSU95_11265 [Betaproteobacteria bacterium]
MKVFGSARISTGSGRFWLWCLALALPASVAFGGQADVRGDRLLAMDSATQTEEPLVSEGAQSPGRRLEVGMSLEEALELLGKDPDSESEIGAACGMLDVLTWDDEGTRLISVDGTVTSIYESGTSESE